MTAYKKGVSINSLAKQYGVRWSTVKNFINRFSKMERPKPLTTKPRKHGHPTYRELEYFKKNG